MPHISTIRGGLPAQLSTRLKGASSSFRATGDVILSAPHVAATALLQNSWNWCKAQAKNLSKCVSGRGMVSSASFWLRYWCRKDKLFCERLFTLYSQQSEKDSIMSTLPLEKFLRTPMVQRTVFRKFANETKFISRYLCDLIFQLYFWKMAVLCFLQNI